MTTTSTRSGRSSRPIIGVTLDAEPAGGWSAYPWYALRANYVDAVADAGGLPLALGHRPDLADEMLDAIDALLVTGGAFDIDPALYGGGNRHATVSLKAGRTQAELTLVRGAIERHLPVFGVCGGMQLLAVACGGTLIQHIPDEVRGALAHEQPNRRDEAGHAITLSPGSVLARLTGRDTMKVNSSHHQAVRDPGTLVVSARAPDDVIEAIELPDNDRFCLGVQWHPEFRIDPGDAHLFEAFVARAAA